MLREVPLWFACDGGPVVGSQPSCARRAAFLQDGLQRTGTFLFLPNPRGSSEKGKAFTRAHVKILGPVDWRDILAGTDESHYSLAANHRSIRNGLA